MPEIKTELLFKVEFDVPPTLDLGETPYGRRRIARVVWRIWNMSVLLSTIRHSLLEQVMCT